MGKDLVVSIGVLTPHATPGPAAELPDMAPGQIVTRISRILAAGGDASSPGTPPTSPSGLRALTTPSALDEATAAFPCGSVDVIGYASTSTGYAIGFDAEADMLERLSQRWGLPVAGTSLSAVAALQALRVRRVALVHPPWFDEELNDLGAAYFGNKGSRSSPRSRPIFPMTRGA
jgi:maleate isomerase